VVQQDFIVIKQKRLQDKFSYGIFTSFPYTGMPSSASRFSPTWQPSSRHLHSKHPS